MKIILILPYFGKWPVWFPAFLQSCRYNPDVNWLIFTDCERVDYPSDNVQFIPFSLSDFCEIASQKLRFEVKHSSPYRVCDFKAAYGLIFEDYIKDYDFWGYCDLDQIFGDIRQFITDELLSQYDVITSSLNTPNRRLVGHFTIYRNNQKMRTIFEREPKYKTVFQGSKHVGFSEGKMSNLVKKLCQQGEITAYWPDQNILNRSDFSPLVHKGDSQLPEYANRWYWERGKLYDRTDSYTQKEEVMYLHFMTWKKSLRKCYFNYGEEPQSFYISYSHIGSKFALPPLRSVVDSVKKPIASTKPYQLAKKLYLKTTSVSG